MRRLAKAAVAGALLTALVLPALALGQGGAPTLREEPTAGFPDRAYILQLPQSKALGASQLDVTENGGPVLSVGVQAPGGSASGAVLLIDASNSMRGAPIDGAMVAAREFLGARSDDLPVAIITFGGSTNVLSEFTTDEAKLTEAVAENPPLTEGTAMYDAVVRAAELAQDEGLGRATVVLLSDGNDIGSSATSEEAVAAAREANMRVVSVGLQSAQFEPASLRTLSRSTDGTFALAANEAALAPIFEEIGARLSNEYLVTYRSLLPANVKANVRMAVAGVAAPATASYTTPAIDVTPGGTFEREWIDEVIVSPWLFVFVIVAVLTLIAFAILAAADIRKRSLRRRMAQYVSVPSEEESRMRRAEVTSMLADRAQKNVSRLRSWQGFEADVELANFKMSALAIAAWTIVGGIVVSIAVAAYYQSLWGLLAGLAAPFVTRYIVSRKVKKTKAAFDEQLPDNLDVLAGAMRTGHSIMGALSVMVESADDPSKKEFRRVLQDEQLGVPLDDALMVMARRMQSYDAEQVALVMKLQREAGGNTAEVLDRVAETIRGRMELRRLVNVLTAQARISRWILTSLPIFVFLMLSLSGGDYLDPMTSSLMGKIALVVGAILILIGSFWIKRISKLDV